MDLWDYASIDPATAVADMQRRGVRTLYLQTSRYTCPREPICPNDGPIAHPDVVGAWLEHAHAAGIRVVGWYLPGYADLRRDIQRTNAIAMFRSEAGERFDALAVDIEAREETGGGAAFNDGIARHLAGVRRRVGDTYPIGAIVPAPRAMALRSADWAGFPWDAIGRHADVVLPMAYSSFRHDCNTNASHCPYQYARDNTVDARRLTGLPVHTIGGIGEDMTATEVADFVRGARDANAIGGSLYDYVTTDASFWRALARFND